MSSAAMHSTASVEPAAAMHSATLETPMEPTAAVKSAAVETAMKSTGREASSKAGIEPRISMKAVVKTIVTKIVMKPKIVAITEAAAEAASPTPAPAQVDARPPISAIIIGVSTVIPAIIGVIPAVIGIGIAIGRSVAVTVRGFRRRGRNSLPGGLLGGHFGLLLLQLLIAMQDLGENLRRHPGIAQVNDIISSQLKAILGPINVADDNVGGNPVLVEFEHFRRAGGQVGWGRRLNDGRSWSRTWRGGWGNGFICRAEQRSCPTNHRDSHQTL